MKLARMLLFVVIVANLCGLSYAAEGPAMLPIFGKHARSASSGWQFTEYACGYPNGCVYHPGWDFNLSVPNDQGQNVYAIADGTVILDASHVINGVATSWGVLVIEHNINGQHFYSQYGHVKEIYVTNGQQVMKGNRIAKVGDVGAEGSYHLHWEIRTTSHGNPTDPDYWNDNLKNYSTVTSWYRNPERMIVRLDIDAERIAQGEGNYGSLVQDNDWFIALNADAPYNGDNTPKTCYVQKWSGGAFGACGVVFDALGGTRTAYTVRNGFWGTWNGAGGPSSSIGIPITNEYSPGGSTSRQDFQKGYLYWDGNTASVHTYPSRAPGWTSSGWNNQYSYLFARAYERNGARNTMGEATGNVYSYGTFLRQDFSGGSFGNCCILYDPDNANQNAAATNEAYLLRSEFYAHYNAVVGYQAYGCPSLDEYNWNDPGDKVQFFVKRDGSSNPQHRMEYDASTGQFAWHSVYATQWVSQTPPSSFAMERDSTRVFTVQFRNTGTTTWYNNAGSYPYDYVVLKSCDPDGSAATSLLYASGLGWLDSQTPCTMQEASVAPNGTATFTFTGKVASTQAYGLMNIYFRPAHSMAGLLDGWGGMHYPITVIDATSFAGLTLTPIAGDWNNDGSFEVGVYADETRYFYLDTNNDGYTDLEIAYSAAIDEPLAGNWDNSGGYTVGFYRPPDRVFWLDYDNNGEMDVSLTFGNSGDLPVVGDWQGTGYTRIGLYRPSTRTFWLDYNNDGAADASATFGDAGDIPLSGDWDGDVDWTIGLYRPSTRTFWLDNNNDGAADFSRTFGDAGDLPIVGDWTGNGGTNIGVFRTSNKYFWLDFDSDGYPDRGFQLRRTVPGTPKVTTPDEGTTLPLAFTLNQNYPNPFNPVTTIAYALPTTTHVTLDVFNILGQCVATLVDEQQQPGNYQVNWDASRNASGIYFYRIQTGEAMETKKMLLLK